MFTRRIVICIIIVGVCAGAIFFALHLFKEKDEGIQYLIGVSFSDLSNMEQLSLYNEINERAQSYENVRVVSTNATASKYTQIKDMEMLVKLGVDILLVYSEDVLVIKNEISKIHKAIPVMVLDKEISGYAYDLFIGPDDYDIGYNAGKKVTSILGDNAGAVVEIMGSLESNATRKRTRGFSDALSGTGIRVVYSFYGESNINTTEEKLFNFVKENKNVDMVFAHDHAMAQGAASALERAGIRDVNIISIGNVSSKQEQEDLDDIDTLILYTIDGRQIIENAIQIINGTGVIPRKIIVQNYEKESEALWYLNGNDSEYEPVDMGGPFMIGMVCNGSQDQWCQRIYRHLEKTLHSQNVSFLLSPLYGLSDEEKKANQITALDALIEAKTDLILFTPCSPDGFDEILIKAKINGVQVILLDENISPTSQLPMTYVGYDYFDEGKIAAEWIVDNVYSSDKDIIIGEIYDHTQAFSTQKRKEGFINVISGYLRIRIVESVCGKSTHEDGKLAMEQIFKNHHDINLVYVHNEEMALGAMQAIREKGLDPGRDVILIVNNGMDKSQKALEKQQINCIIQREYASSQYLTDHLYKLYRGGLTYQKIMLGNRVLEWNK